jgi:CRP/FNR family transcriptional activator FtrB
MREQDRAACAALPLFDGVSEAEVAALLAGAFVQRFPVAVDLAHEGERADFLHYIVEGEVEVYARHRDHETTIAVFGRDHAFIVAAVVTDRVYLKSARTRTPARILMIPAEPVRTAFSRDATFARRLALQMADGYRTMVKELKNQKLRTGIERLANWLLVADQAAGGTGRFTLSHDKKALAGHLGMTPESLSRAFSALASCQVVVRGAAIELNDRAALVALAHPSTTIDDPEV